MNIIGSKIVGYRYGEAPECGRSFNTQTRQYECGVSMAPGEVYGNSWLIYLVSQELMVIKNTTMKELLSLVLVVR